MVTPYDSIAIGTTEESVEVGGLTYSVSYTVAENVEELDVRTGDLKRIVLYSSSGLTSTRGSRFETRVWKDRR